MNYKTLFISLFFVFLTGSSYSQISKDSLSSILSNYAKQIDFEIGNTKLKKGVDVSIFTKIAALMIKNSAKNKFEISGHTSSVGRKDLNKVLSQKRVDLLKNVFVEYGVKKEVLTARGEGEESPITHNSSPQSRALNKRIEITVIPQKD